MITILLNCDHHFKKTTGVVRRKYALSFIFLPQGSVLMKVLHYQLSFLVIQFFSSKTNQSRRSSSSKIRA